MPSRISKYRVLAQLGTCHIRRDIGKSERVEGQKSLYTAGGPTGYTCSATSLHRIGGFQIPISRARLQNTYQLYSSE